ncbi:MAG: hypothetical protein LH614_16015 [Pyrinomonadaceae bacterium]|nr:hypothetical protein [Pyrinomonadaceae bacterium]
MWRLRLQTGGAAAELLTIISGKAQPFRTSSGTAAVLRNISFKIYLGLGCALYALIPSLANAGNLALFVGTFCLILTMYGGGFATIPAYLRDMFGTMQVGAIHGRLLTAWSAAAIAGPTIVTYLRDYQINSGIPKAQVYSTAIYVMAGLPVIGFISNLLIKPVDSKHHFQDNAAPSAPPEPETAGVQQGATA